MVGITISEQNHRYELVATRGITLDGHKAVIGGVKQRFATVIDLVTGTSYEWAWETVEHIIRNKGGAFKS